MRPSFSLDNAGWNVNNKMLYAIIDYGDKNKEDPGNGGRHRVVDGCKVLTQ